MKKTFFSLLTIGAMVAGFIACKEEVQYDIEISNPKTTLTVGEKIDIKITSTPEGLDLSAVEYEFSPEGIIEASRTDNGFQLVAKKNGKTRLKISCGKFEKEIPFTVNAKKTETNNDSGNGDGGSSSDSESGDDSGNSDSSSEKEDEGETPKPETPEEPSDSTKTEPTPVEPTDTTKTEPETPKKVSVIFNTGEGGYYLNSNNSITRATIRIGTPGTNLPAPPEITFNPEFEFIGWKPELPKVYPDTNTTYIAQYKPKNESETPEAKNVKITFLQGDNGTFAPKAQTTFTVEAGEEWILNAPQPVANYGYEFIGWYPNLPNNFPSDENSNYTAQYREKNKSKVIFKIDESKLVSGWASGLGTTGQYRYEVEGYVGEAFTESMAPTIIKSAGFYAFRGWDYWKLLPKVFPENDMEITVPVERNIKVTFKIQSGFERYAWFNGNKNTTELMGLDYAGEPLKMSYIGNQTIPPTVNVASGYMFCGWDKEVPKNYPNESITITAKIDQYTGMENSHAYVDLGLPSGTMWATCNVGATHSEDYGGYYQWGTTYDKGASRIREYVWDYYTHYSTANGMKQDLLTYPNGVSKFKPEYDAAQYHWKGRWQVPNKEDWEELLQYCDVYWQTNPKGIYLRPKNINYMENSIFLPAAGKASDIGKGFVTAYDICYYWAASKGDKVYSEHTMDYGRYYVYSFSGAKEPKVEKYHDAPDGKPIRAVFKTK